MNATTAAAITRAAITGVATGNASIPATAAKQQTDNQRSWFIP